jgi:hypothetical protein
MRPLVVPVLALALAASSAAAKDENKIDVKKRKVTVFVEGTGCAYDVEAKPLALKKGKREALGLRIKNDCGFEQRGIVCAFDADNRRVDAFTGCTSVPAGLALGTPFKLAAGGGTVDLDCMPGEPGKLGLVVMIAKDVPASCPAAPVKERLGAIGEIEHNHRLEVEILPEAPAADKHD